MDLLSDTPSKSEVNHLDKKTIQLKFSEILGKLERVSTSALIVCGALPNIQF